MNFDFLKEQSDYYGLFADACAEAEKVFATSPAMCAVGCRKALELAVKWVYAADSTIKAPYKDNLSSLLHEPTFRYCVDERIWHRLIGVNKLGNLAVHTDKRVTPQDAILSLRSLFDFVDWIDYCYGPNYQTRSFDESAIPPKGVPLTKEQIETIKSNEALIVQKDETIRSLEAKVAEMSAELTASKGAHAEDRSFNPEEISEYETRKHYIDWDIELAGWTIGDTVIEERPVTGMPDTASGEGSIDYLFLGKDGKPLALLEAKRTMHDPRKGLQQARLYASCLQAEYGYRPPIFLSNGFETFFVDDETAPMREVSGVFSRDELAKILNRRKSAVPPSTVRIDETIVGGERRYYQIEAIRKTCANIEEGHRKSLLVMATGTGKTRVSAALADVLMRSGQVKNVLFLADRVALVSQAKHAYQKYLPNASLCNLCQNREDRNARIVFSTYPTILNAIDGVRSEDGTRMYTPAHFDLIIIDEAHRSIFKKYRAIFQYFDALLVGLTATPADEVDRNTYDFFEVERGVPTYVYDYKTATETDKVLVPYLGIETHTSFLDEGIVYDDLSEEDKERLEDDFEETGQDRPDQISPSEIDEWIFNEGTVRTVLETLMEKGIRADSGETLGKTIIFAQSQKHARFIEKVFGKLYPQLADGYLKCVIHSDDYSHTIIDEFELKPRPVIAVSVDMMDTGIDVPEIVNLVFFKKVRSKIKFWQMIGRGTRLCEGLEVLDPLDGAHEDKERFFIFDWCRNFEFFNENPKTQEGKIAPSISEVVFSRQAQLAKDFQESAYIGDGYRKWRVSLVGEIHYQVVSLDEELVTVRLHLAAVEKFKQEASYDFITDSDLGTLKVEIAPLVHSDEKDIDALRFDAFMYGFICALCDGVHIGSYVSNLTNISLGLQKMTSIPQVAEKLPVLQRVAGRDYFDDITALELEKVRKELRGIIRFLVNEGPRRKDVYTNLADPLTQEIYGITVDPGEDFSNYDLKIRRYLNDYSDSLVIQKLRKNLPMTRQEIDTLGNIFTHELGNSEDYKRTYGDTPFGLLVRKVVKLDRDAAMEAFGEFLNDESLTEQQISFVHNVIDYIVSNGYMEPSALGKPPFDRPQSFVRLFDTEHQMGLIKVIKSIKSNAEAPAA